MRHRLPLSGPAQNAQDTRWDGPRLSLPWPAIGIADTARGLEATQFALEFGEAAHAAGVRTRVLLVDFSVAPQLDGALAARFAALGELACHRFDERPPSREGSLELWVGTPAVVALAPRLAILLGTQRPPLEWPSVLRGAAAQCQLALPSARVGLARALVEELSGRGFLPASAHGVR